MINSIFELFRKFHFITVLSGLAILSTFCYLANEYIQTQGWIQYESVDGELVVYQTEMGWDMLKKGWPFILVTIPFVMWPTYVVTAWGVTAAMEIDNNSFQDGLSRIKEFDKRIMDSIEKRLRDISLLSEHYLKIEQDRYQSVYESEQKARFLKNDNERMKKALSKNVETLQFYKEKNSEMLKTIEQLQKTAGSNISDYLKPIDEIKVIEAKKSDLENRLANYLRENTDLKAINSDLEFRLKNALKKLEKTKTE
jgi:hypothetical protein